VSEELRRQPQVARLPAKMPSRVLNWLLRLPIRWQLGLVALVLALPATFIVASTGLRSRDDAISAARTETQELAAEIAFTQTNMVVAAGQLLTVLAQLPDVQDRHAERVRSLLRDCLRLDDQYSNLFVADRTGRVWASAVEVTMNVADRRYFQKTLESQRLSSGEYVTSRATGRPAFNLGYPVRDARGELAGVISVGFNLDRHRELLESSRAAPGTGYLLLDHAGVVLSRGLDPGKLVGKQYEADPFQRMLAGPERDTLVARSMAGDQRLISYRKLWLPGEEEPYMFVRVGTPMEAVVDKANRALVANLLLLLPSLLLALFLAGLFAKRAIADRTTHLQRAAERVAAGDLSVRVTDEVVGGELGGLARTFDAMATRLQEREGERTRAEADRSRLEDQLRHAQKLEAVGRLAGGVAHDFNNLLTAIRGSAELVLAALPEGSPHRPDLVEINQASDRAAALTRQLLAFSRKQVLSPTVVDLNRAVRDSHRLLTRLIGEDVEILLEPDETIGRVRVDPGQLGQVLANLAVNARDAMPAGGIITIRTCEVDVDEAYAGQSPDARPGRWVQLAFSDNGHGMTPEVRAHLFEPFFTTKGPGAGTGLGLATIYGIVKQSGGFITVYSEPSAGTTLKLHFPRVDEAETAAPAAPGPSAALPSGVETILIVEDEPAVLRLVRQALDRQGYRLLVASTPADAIALAQASAEPISLCLTDVILPGMNGRELVAELRRLRPALRVVFMSGYSANILAPHGVLEPGMEFLEKPFTVEALARRVRQVLDRPAPIPAAP
jgi:signal transduction histidine kinase/ActR/RegA family two-component response regulator